VIKKDSLAGAMIEFLTPEEVADILRINVLTVYSYIQRDNLNAVRLGRNYRISRQDLSSFIKSKRIQKLAVERNKEKKL
jgi:excisionase family DNA binding protein